MHAFLTHRCPKHRKHQQVVFSLPVLLPNGQSVQTPSLPQTSCQRHGAKQHGEQRWSGPQRRVLVQPDVVTLIIITQATCRGVSDNCKDNDCDHDSTTTPVSASVTTTKATTVTIPTIATTTGLCSATATMKWRERRLRCAYAQ